ncbi:MAG: hypothetical protein PF518_02540 [Spirochaetaceae bacterium]|jgi:shikimate kinase|nr:hypothetical protein [Spirochaetaceae bacterium]
MYRIILSGIKHSGKSTIGWDLSSKLGLYFADLDDLILRDAGKYETVRELYKDLGSEGFKKQEYKSLLHFLKVNKNKGFVLSLGGGTIDNEKAKNLLSGSESEIKYFLDAHCDDLYQRIIHGGIPPFLEGNDPYLNFVNMYDRRTKMYKEWADFNIDTRGLKPSEISSLIADMLQNYT